MSVDFQQAKSLKEMVQNHSRSGNLALYSEAQERGMSLSEILEEMDPSPRNDQGEIIGELDAFERQLYLNGVISSGKSAITMEQFFVGPGLVLIPEYILREIKRGYTMVQDPIELIAASVPVTGPTVKPIYIKVTEAKKSLAERSDGASYPAVNLMYREKEAAILDRGRRFDFSYKVIKNQKLAEFRVFLWWIGAQMAYDEIDEIYSIIVNGDGTSPAATDVFDGEAGTFAYSDLVTLAMAFDVPSRMTHVLGTKADIKVILNMSQFQDANAWKANELYQRTGKLQSFMPVNSKLVVTPNATATKFAALDHRFAVRESVSQPLMIEAEKVISQKLESAVVSKESVYTIMVDDAVYVSDY
jgi:hypothetical protein